MGDRSPWTVCCLMDFMQIVKLMPNRWEEYRDLRLEALRTDPDAFGATIEGTLARPEAWWRDVLSTALVNPNKTAVFAELDGRLIGMAGAYPEEAPGCVDITGMFVTPTQRGKGIGRRLLQAVTDEVTAETVRLYVNASMTAAVTLYERFGFVTFTTGPVVRADGSSFDQLGMELRHYARSSSQTE